MWGLEAWPSSQKSACNFMVSPLYLRFGIAGFNQPQIVQYILSEKIPPISGPTQFKSMLFKGPL